jgi:hypothetical protein
MPRYTRIQEAEFDGQSLPLAVSVTVTRRCEPAIRADDADDHPSSVQTHRTVTEAEIVCRDVAATDALSIGQAGTLSLVIASADGASPGRAVTLDGAVLTRTETRYSQTAPAAAALRFACESVDGAADPFGAEDQS